ncbi:hypothetical protein [Streptomyces sp. NPDC005017]|uniref:hypothetical protein n=1 Tax=Streptomyces sp. NPDC005017 TaxID=3364706 RepID=UPI0036B4226D
MPEQPAHPNESSDAELVANLARGASHGPQALQVLRSRHFPALRDYARLCVQDERIADQLTRQVMSSAAQTAAAGRVRSRAVRHNLLLHVQRLAAQWATDERHHRLRPAFTRWVAEVGGDPANPLRHWADHNNLLRAFWQLPQFEQELLWYAEIEGSDRELASRYAGTGQGDFGYHREHALTALRHAYLGVHGTKCSDKDCRGYVRILQAAAQSPVPGISPDFDAHRVDCLRCEEALHDLTTLYTAPQLALTTGLIGYAGPAYAASSSGRNASDPAARTAGCRTHQRPSIALPLALTVLVLALAAGAIASLRTSAHTPAQSGGGSTTAATAPAPEGATASAAAESRPPSSPAVRDASQPSRLPVPPVTASNGHESSAPAGAGTTRAATPGLPASGDERLEPGAGCVTHSASSTDAGSSLVVIQEANGSVSVSSQQQSTSEGGHSSSIVVRCTSSGSGD